MDAFPAITGGNDVLPTVAAQLTLAELGRSLRVCKAWLNILNSTPHLWRALSAKTWGGKAYVPESLRALAERDFASENDTKDAEARQRQYLMGLKIADLKQLMRRFRVSTSNPIEKGDFADAIIHAQRTAAAGHDKTQNLLARPWLLARQSEALPKAAMRLSLEDARRLRISEDELTSLVFSVRVRNDGPLAQAMSHDPWWQVCSLTRMCSLVLSH